MTGDRQTGSVTGWIVKLKQGDEVAAQQILDRYFGQIVAIARQRIAGTLRVADEEDVAIEAFESLFKAFAVGRLESLENRGDLWALLVTTAYRKTCDYWRKDAAQKRGGPGLGHESPGTNEPHQPSVPQELDQVAVENASAEFLAAIADQHRFLMGKLEAKDDQLAEVATLILQGYTNGEIAEQWKCSERRIERKRKLIRDIWKHALGEPP